MVYTALYRFLEKTVLLQSVLACLVHCHFGPPSINNKVCKEETQARVFKGSSTGTRRVIQNIYTQNWILQQIQSAEWFRAKWVFLYTSGDSLKRTKESVDEIINWAYDRRNKNYESMSKSKEFTFSLGRVVTLLVLIRSV
jgi:hypothetical protein